MGRPPLGPSARKHPITVRLTTGEVERLTTTYGSPAKGLRALLDAKGKAGDTGSRETAEAGGDPRKGPAGKALGLVDHVEGRKHRHRVGKTVAERYDGGQKQVRPVCSECGALMDWRKG